MKGWIKLHKKLRNHELYLTDPTAFRLFMGLLMYAKTETGTYTCGRYQLSTMTGIPPETVRKALKRLEQKWQIVTTKSTNKYTEITVVNWGYYQSREADGTTSSTNKVPTKYQQSTTKKETRYKKQDYNIKSKISKSKKKTPKEQEQADEHKKISDRLDVEASKAFAGHEDDRPEFSFMMKMVKDYGIDELVYVLTAIREKYANREVANVQNATLYISKVLLVRKQTVKQPPKVHEY